MTNAMKIAVKHFPDIVIKKKKKTKNKKLQSNVQLSRVTAQA